MEIMTIKTSMWRQVVGSPKEKDHKPTQQLS